MLYNVSFLTGDGPYPMQGADTTSPTYLAYVFLVSVENLPHGLASGYYCWALKSTPPWASSSRYLCTPGYDLFVIGVQELAQPVRWWKPHNPSYKGLKCSLYSHGPLQPHPLPYGRDTRKPRLRVLITFWNLSALQADNGFHARLRNMSVIIQSSRSADSTNA